jgi:hypothetical protein
MYAEHALSEEALPIFKKCGAAVKELKKNLN